MTKKLNTNAWLKRFIKERNLTRPQVARACAVSLSTVDRWLAPPRKSSHRKMPYMGVKLLTYMDIVGDLDEDVRK